MSGPFSESIPDGEQWQSPRRVKRQRLCSWTDVRSPCDRAFFMMHPDIQWRESGNVDRVEVGAFLVLASIVKAVISGPRRTYAVPTSYLIALDAWLFPTVLFADFDGFCRGPSAKPS